MSRAKEAFGVYVHWPFCLSKCPYCDFNSHVRHGGYDEPRYARAVLSELGAAAEREGINLPSLKEVEPICIEINHPLQPSFDVGEIEFRFLLR